MKENMELASWVDLLEECHLSPKERLYRFVITRWFIYSCSQKQSEFLLSPTASGKSLIIYLLSRWYESNRVLILVPTTSLVEQMYSDFLDYGYLEAKMQKIYQGHSREITKEVTISTWQSLYKMPRNF